VCDVNPEAEVVVRFDPPRVVLAPGIARPVRMTVDPDFCKPATASFTTGDDTIAHAPAATTLDLRHASYDFSVAGLGKSGTTTLTVTVPGPDGTPQTGTIEVEVRDGAPPTCAGANAASQTIDGGHLAIAGQGALANAQMSVPGGAFTRQDELAIPPFPATLACADDLTQAAPGKPIALGPAVQFTAKAPVSTAVALRREIDFAIPINPAAFPPAARLRHLQVLFTSPRAKTPRAVTVANPRIDRVGSDYVLRFASPWIGTYQAAVAPDAGTHHRKRKIAHRAVVGVSMGAVGSSTFGLRHHDQFDAIVPMGGPANWTWLVWYIENYALGGFCKAGDSGCQKYAPNMYPINEPIVHTMDFNHFWYQTGSGNGGNFPRSEYLQIFQDLAVMLGDANGQNDDQDNLWYFPRGPKATDKWVTGPTDGNGKPLYDCAITVDPIKDDPNQQQQQLVQDECAKFRCAVDATGRMVNGYVAPSNYFDAKFNPDGSHPVISFCDGGQSGQSPYVDTWRAPTPDEARPVTVALAVDLNGNGVRDADEPVISQGHEDFDDTGTDGVADAQEPGYDPVLNPDPNGDDYDNYINPNGTEANHRHEDGEPYRDNGLDGVPDTATRHVAGDFGENDGKYTESDGLKAFYASDAHSIVHQWSKGIPAGAFDDDALQRFDILSDGGVRDLFNFAVTGSHLTGALGGRARADGTRIRSAAYYNGFSFLPGQTIGKEPDYQPSNTLWADTADFPSIRYGSVDASPSDIDRGDGQHVGTADQLLHRIETSFYFVAKSWSDADRTQTTLARDNPETTTVNPLGVDCEVDGRCEEIFTGPATKRSGPIAVTLPPGYALEENRVRDVRYPVLYVLHGYGQDPRDLEAVAIFTNNFMNAPERSYATRMPKFIVVYVDGRCRIGADGKPECIRGTFWEDSPHAKGAHLDSWFVEVMDHIDKTYRTMPATEIDVTD
jgi:hypothetical protein